MSRIFLAVLATVVVIVLYPPLWESTRPYAELAARPFYRQYAGWRLDEISRLLESEIEKGRPLPARSDFTPYLERALMSESGARDPWGMPYYLKAEPFAIRVGSAGPDRKVGTDDDLLARQVGTGRLRHP